VLTLRYHIVSLVAVFLALAIGVVMGTTVIDSVLVDRLERQQDTLSEGIDDLQQERDEIQERLERMEDADTQLSEEGSQRLLAGALPEVPVLVVAVEGNESESLEALVDLLGTAGANYEGTLWLGEELALEDEDGPDELARALGLSAATDADLLRGLAVNRIAAELETAAAVALPGEARFDSIDALRTAGFVDYEPPEGAPDDLANLAAPGTRVIVVGGDGGAVPDEQLAGPLVDALVDGSEAPPNVLTLAAEGVRPEEGTERAATFVAPLRSDEELSARVSTVDNLDEFAGRLAAVLALQDLGDLRFGHYGHGPGASRLLPPPAPAG
jgi:hypothetical protein